MATVVMLVRPLYYSTVARESYIQKRKTELTHTTRALSRVWIEADVGTCGGQTNLK